MGHAVITPRPQRGALLTVSIGDSETREWRTDPAFRDGLTRDISKRALQRGRKYFEIRDARGVALLIGEVSK
jgi:hypothetical protein